MTLVVGFVSPEHAVMAADSQATEADGTRTRVEKIWRDSGLLLGYTGVAALRDTLAEEIATSLALVEPSDRADRKAVRDLLCAVTKPVLDRAYNNSWRSAANVPRTRLVAPSLS
jgi:20S proteasome alpha/beta subunit